MTAITYAPAYPCGACGTTQAVVERMPVDRTVRVQCAQVLLACGHTHTWVLPRSQRTPVEVGR